MKHDLKLISTALLCATLTACAGAPVQCSPAPVKQLQPIPADLLQPAQPTFLQRLQRELQTS